MILLESRRAFDLYNAIHDKCPLVKATHKRDKERDRKIRANSNLLSDEIISTEEFLNLMAEDDRRMCIIYSQDCTLICVFKIFGI